MKKTWIATLAALAALALGCSSGGSSDDTPLNAVDNGPTSAPSPKPTKAGTIGNGTWQVPDDVKVGTYRSTGMDARGLFCNWSVKKPGGHFAGSGGTEKTSDPQIVQLEAGQTFETSDCAVWILKKS